MLYENEKNHVMLEVIANCGLFPMFDRVVSIDIKLSSSQIPAFPFIRPGSLRE